MLTSSVGGCSPVRRHAVTRPSAARLPRTLPRGAGHPSRQRALHSPQPPVPIDPPFITPRNLYTPLNPIPFNIEFKISNYKYTAVGNRSMTWVSSVMMIAELYFLNKADNSVTSYRITYLSLFIVGIYFMRIISR